jgi:hypothetical protein
MLGKNDRGGADFSPDMALGVELYLVRKKDFTRAQKWLDWLQKLNPTNNLIDTIKPPRLCRTQNCTMRPADGAVLAEVVEFMRREAGLPMLPDGRLRGFLGTFGEYAVALATLGSLNAPGFPQHLTATSIAVLREAGKSDPRLDLGAQLLFLRNTKNAFFAYLAGAPRRTVEDITLEKCPDSTKDLSGFNQWQWERVETENNEPVWKNTMLWDCIFMAHLLATKR